MKKGKIKNEKTTLKNLTNYMEAFAEMSPKAKLYCEDTDKNVSFISWKALLNTSGTFSIDIIKEDSEVSCRSIEMFIIKNIIEKKQSYS